MEREERLLDTARKQAALIRKIIEIAEKESTIAYPAIVHELVESGLDVSDIASGKSWYDWNIGDIDGHLLRGKMTEMRAAKIRGIDLLSLREHMAEMYGDNWRDMQDEDEE
jgi:hypothetical protein